MVESTAKPTRPALLISKTERQLRVYSDEFAGQNAWVIDWDNDMQPDRLSVVVDGGATAHVVPISRLTPDCDKTLDLMERHITRNGRGLALDNACLNTVLAALRTLQLQIEKNEVPQGILEHFYEVRPLPEPEALDQLCEAFNFDER